jgi:hypothetical protein
MRASAAILIALFLPGLARAEDWREYTYPKMGFAVSFPAEPTVLESAYEAAPGVSVTARTDSLQGPGTRYRVTVADLSKTGLDEDDVIAAAVKAIASSGKVTLNLRARVNRVFGRQLSVTEADGGHSSIALFYYDKKLYRIQGTVLGTSSDAASGEAIRFQQSLRFIDGPSFLGGLFGLFR